MVCDDFYDNLNWYHEKADSVLRFLVDYLKENKQYEYDHSFLAFKIEDYKVIESNIEIDDATKASIEKWVREIDKKVDIDEDIYRFNINDKVYIFKAFFLKDSIEIVLAGYLIEDSITVRSFLISLGEELIRKRYKKILSVL